LVFGNGKGVIVVLVFYFDGVGIGHGFLSYFLFNYIANLFLAFGWVEFLSQESPFGAFILNPLMLPDNREG
jgi:hypothetical protein